MLKASKRNREAFEYGVAQIFRILFAAQEV